MVVVAAGVSIKCWKCKKLVGRVTARGTCDGCVVRSWREAADQIKAKKGPFYKKWLAGMRKAVR